MSQTRKIHDFLVHSQSTDADKALLMALRRAEEPYGTALLETILDRKQPASCVELIKNYPHYPDPWKKILTDRIEDLHSPLRLAADSHQAQVRFTTLSMIQEAGYGRLLDIVVRLLRDTNPKVAQRAAETLAGLGRDYSSKMFSRATNFSTVKWPQKNKNDERDHWIFLTSLDGGLRNYPLHRCPQAVYAAMCTVPATNKPFWRDRLESHHPIGKIVRNHLIHSNDPELADFFLSAFGCDELRIPVIQALSNRLHVGFVIEVMRKFSQRPDERVRRGLALVRRARWFDPQVLSPKKMDESSQPAAIDFVMALGAPVESKADFLAAISLEGCEKAGLKAVEKLSQFPQKTAAETLRRSVNSIHEKVALSALARLIQMEKHHVQRLLAEQLKSPHPRVRASARSWLKDYLLEQCRLNFDKLNHQGQSAAARALLKIDPGFQDRWRKLSADADPAHRLRAIQMARQLGWVDVTLTRLLEMTKDSDKTVASCAVAALGQAGMPAPQCLEDRLIAALQDEDMRVRANAIEAIQRRDTRSAMKLIERFANHSHNRIRANSIRTLLQWKVKSAPTALTQMLSDERPPHRQSAQWVLREVQTTEVTPDQAGLHHSNERKPDVASVGV